MDSQRIPKRISMKREHPSQPQKEWLQDREYPSFYALYIDAVPTQIDARHERMNNRGLTLVTIGLTGEMIQFTLKPNLWNFIYEVD